MYHRKPIMKVFPEGIAIFSSFFRRHLVLLVLRRNSFDLLVLRTKMPVNVHPAIRFSRYAALLIGIGYGYRRNEYLKPKAAHDREIEALKAKEKAELLAARQAAAAKEPLF